MKQRDQVAMTGAQTAALLAECRKLQLATINADGTPHLVTMYYALVHDAIAFWTYRASQKARNLARDPRVSCLVETGERYFDLRGALITGTVTCVDDPAGVLDIGRRVAAVMAGGSAGHPPAWPPGSATAAAAGLAGSPDDAAAEQYLARTAGKRVGYLVTPRRIATWDHAKLLPPAPPATSSPR